MVYTYALIFFFPQDVHFLESFPTAVSKSQPLFQAKFLFPCFTACINRKLLLLKEFLDRQNSLVY